MKRNDQVIAILHFQPLELFPPITNLINFFAAKSKEKAFVISTSLRKEVALPPFESKSFFIKIVRTPSIVPGSAFRIFNYLQFYLRSLCLLIIKKPGVVLYYDTISSWPALMYKKLRGDKLRLMTHYHEYTTPAEYAQDMRLVKWMNSLEKRKYSNSYYWISHTNPVRLEKFRNDHSLKKGASAALHVMPNYPSKSWTAKETKQPACGDKIRLVYAGALGYDTMYLKEITDWIISNKENFSLDFYAYNVDTKSRQLLDSIKDESINLHAGCSYGELPGILKNYDVGIVIYKPYSENMINNVSNKVFEYLASGLDVWFSKYMTYTFAFKRENVYPKILPVDFSKLASFDFKKALSRNGLSYQPSDYFYEDVYEEIYKNIIARAC